MLIAPRSGHFDRGAINDYGDSGMGVTLPAIRATLPYQNDDRNTLLTTRRPLTVLQLTVLRLKVCCGWTPIGSGPIVAQRLLT